MEKNIRDKVQRKEKLTVGETLAWDELRNDRPLEVRFVEEIDFMLSFDE